MKIFRSLLLAGALLQMPARAAEDHPAIPGLPDMRGLMIMLNKLLVEAGVEPEAASAPAAPVPKESDPPLNRPPLTTSPKLSRLGSISLTASGSLGERGPGPAARMSHGDWRLLFAVRQTAH